MLSKPDGLRYLSSDHVAGPVPCYYVDVRNREDRPIGALDGVIIDIDTNRLEYLVVDTRRQAGHDRFLLPFASVEVDMEHHALRVDVDDSTLAQCELFDPQAFPAFA